MSPRHPSTSPQVSDDDVRCRLEIEQALLSYTRGVDRRDWALVRAAYHPDAIDDHGGYVGDVDGFVAYLRQRHDNIEQSMHALTNINVEKITASVALVESYYICYQRLASAAGLEAAFGAVDVGPDETIQLEVLGRYVDRFERREAGWRIAHRKVTFEVMKATATPLRGGLSVELAVSRRDAEDPLWVERRRLLDADRKEKTSSDETGHGDRSA